MMIAPMKSKMKSKKAMALDTLGILMILIIIMIVMFLFIQQNKKNTEAVSDAELCRNTILSKSQEYFKIPINKDVAAKCPTNYINFNKKISDSDINKKILDQRDECWYKLGGDLIISGDADPFKDTKTFCVVCSVFDFGPNNREIKGVGLDYMKLQSKYITQEQYDDALTKLQSLESDKIDGREKYTMIVVESRDKEFIEKAKKPAGILGSTFIVGGGIYVISGAAAVTAGTILSGGTIIIIGSIGAVYSYYADPGEPQLIAMTTLVKYNKEELQNMGCQELPVSVS